MHGPDSLSDGLYRHKIEFEGFDVYLKIQTRTSKEIEILFEYMFGPDLKPFSEAADSAMVCAFSITGNGMACNIGVRAAVYLYKNDPILFPEKTFGNWGAPLFCDSVVNDTCHTAPENILSGEVTWEGQANKMYDDLDNGRLSKFASIANAEECNYPDFGELQKQANNGGIIIGVKKNSAGHGHVVLIMPKSFNEGNDPTSFSIGIKTVKYPICLECGRGQKKIEPFRDINNISDYKWYEY